MRGDVHVRPAVELLLQHWVAGLMHRPPHLTSSEAQFAGNKRGPRTRKPCLTT